MMGNSRVFRNIALLTFTFLATAGCLTGEETSGFSTTATIDVNSPPSISGTASLQVTAGTAYRFRPTVSDPDGDALTFSITGLPRWASFDASSGELSGTPRSGDVGTFSNIFITVSDGTDSARLGPFAVIVVEDTNNSRPSISGSPAGEVMAGTEYAFSPTAADPDGDSLSFSIAGKPSWASFDTASGQLGGTPEVGDVGNYSNIVITVTDGSESVALSPFAILVRDRTLGSVTLSWEAPTQYEDGSPLSDLDGYRLYWGTTPGNYTESVTIDNASITTYVVENLPTGTYEFAATSFNAVGVESRYSSPVTKTVM